MKKYEPPSWFGVPSSPFYIDVIREGSVIEQHTLKNKDHFTIGAQDGGVDILYKNPSVSPTHAVIQFNKEGSPFLVDLNSASGTWKGDLKLESNEYVPLQSGDRITFGSKNAKRSFWFFSYDSAYPSAVKHSLFPSIEDNLKGFSGGEASLFETSGRLSTGSKKYILSREQHSVTQPTEITWGIEGEDSYGTLDQIRFKKYLNSITGRLDIYKMKQLEDLTGLTEPQLELLNSIETLQSQRNQVHSEEESLNETGAVPDSHHAGAVDNEIRHRISEFMESFELCPVSHILTESTIDALDDRLFDENDDFYDRSENPAKLKDSSIHYTQKKLQEELKTIREDLESVKIQIKIEEDLVEQLGKEQQKEEEDELDRYMKQNEKMLENSKLMALRKQRDLLMEKIQELEGVKQGKVHQQQNVEKKHTREYNKANNKASLLIAEIALNRANKKLKQ